MNILKDPSGVSDLAFTLYAMECEGEFDFDSESEEDEDEELIEKS